MFLSPLDFVVVMSADLSYFFNEYKVIITDRNDDCLLSSAQVYMIAKVFACFFTLPCVPGTTVMYSIDFSDISGSTMRNSPSADI